MFVLGQHLYSAFLVAKKGSADFRSCIDLRPFDKFCFVGILHFESFHKCCTLIGKSNFFASCDLKDSCFHLAIHPAHQKYLIIQVQLPSWGLEFLQFTTLAFCYARAPCAFPKITKQVFRALRNSCLFLAYKQRPLNCVLWRWLEMDYRLQCINHLDDMLLIFVLSRKIMSSSTCFALSSERWVFKFTKTSPLGLRVNNKNIWGSISAQSTMRWAFLQAPKVEIHSLLNVIVASMTGPSWIGVWWGVGRGNVETK